MDCNKEEALRAKVLAENKMRNGDFVGAKKIAQKAQQLFPEIENIFQLLSVCDVHCSAQMKINGSETDWYGILQVERTADESLIRKQYRKLALLLHPDKNKFSGAEAAFKLIGEANMILSDRDKRHMFDTRIKMVVRSTTSKAPPHRSNRNTHTRKNHVVQGATSSHFTGHVNIQPHIPSNQKQTFWTCCPFCNVKYQYYKDFINRALRCQSCVRPFIAYDLGDQGVPVTRNHSAVNQQKTVPDPGYCGSRVQNCSSNLPSSSEIPGNVGGKAGGKAPILGKGSGTANVAGDGLHKGRDCETVDISEKDHLPRGDKAIPQYSGAPKKNKPKKGRKQVVESSESSLNNKSRESDDNPDHDSDIDSGKHPRRSSRQRRNISYSENFSDDDFSSQPKKAKHRGSSIGDENVKIDTIQTNIPVTETGFSHTVAESMENLTENTDEDPRAETVDHDDGESNVFEVDVNSKLEGNYFVVPDAEFYNFEMAKEDDCFAVGQIWAVYDPMDGMPRFYVRVVKVLLPGFKLRITWLEPRPVRKDDIKWHNGELPICCGKFGYGKTVVNSEKTMFSHLVDFKFGSTRNTYMIYPKKGETWALFKDWDIGWSFDPENHRKNGFEVVQVISDFQEKSGAKVVYLERVEGFVSLFRRVTEGLILFIIPPTEKLRFSHQIPTVVTNGTEKEGVEAGYFELDPAALPLEWFGSHHSDNDRADDTEGEADLKEKQNPGFEKSMESRHPARLRTGGNHDKQPTSQMEGYEKFTDNCEVESDMRTGSSSGAVKYHTNVKRSHDLKIPMKGHGVNGSSEKNNADVLLKEGIQYRDSRLKQPYSNIEECDEVYVVNDGES